MPRRTSPPRAVSRTATSRSERPRICQRAGRARPVARLDHPLVRRGRRRTSSSRPAASARIRMWVDQPGDRALAVRAGDRHDRDPAVRVADPRRRRRPRLRDRRLPAGERARLAPASARRSARTGETSRSVRATAASAIARARSAPVHGNVTIQWPGSDERWTADAAAALAVVEAEPADPVDDLLDPARPVASRDRRAEPDERVAAGLALAVPRPPPADRDLDLDHRRQPVDVRSLEQSDLDQAHGPARITRRPARRLAVVDTLDRARIRRHRRRARRARGGHPGRRAGLPRRPRAPRQHRLRQLHAGGRRRGRPVRRRLPGGARGARSRPGRIRRDASGRRSSGTLRGAPGGGPRSC